MTWLVTGGAGYIGAHVVRGVPRARASTVVVVDDLSSGHRASSPRTCPFVEGSILDTDLLGPHAARARGRRRGARRRLQVRRGLGRSARCTPTSRTSPARSAAAGDGGGRVDKIVFSSSAATYGTPDDEVVTEESPTAPRVAVRRDEADRRVAAARPGHRHRARPHVAALLQRGRLRHPSELYDTSPHNLFPLVFEASSPAHAADQRRRLPHPGRHLRARLRPRRRPRDLPRRRRAGPRRRARPSSRSTTSAAATGSRSARSWTRWPAVTGIDFEPEIAPAPAGDPARIVASGELAARDLDWKMRHTVDDMVASAWAARQAAHAPDDPPAATRRPTAAGDPHDRARPVPPRRQGGDRDRCVVRPRGRVRPGARRGRRRRGPRRPPRRPARGHPQRSSRTPAAGRSSCRPTSPTPRTASGSSTPRCASSATSTCWSTTPASAPRSRPPRRPPSSSAGSSTSTSTAATGWRRRAGG